MEEDLMKIWKEMKKNKERNEEKVKNIEIICDSI